MATHSFSSVLERLPGKALWTTLSVPPEVQEAFPATGDVPVRGTMNGKPYRCTLRRIGAGPRFMLVNKQLREACGMAPGEPVDVVLEMDTEERLVQVPADLAEALAAKPEIALKYEKLPKSPRFAFVRWLEATHIAETRQRRVARILEMVAAGERLGKG